MFSSADNYVSTKNHTHAQCKLQIDQHQDKPSCTQGHTHQVAPVYVTTRCQGHLDTPEQGGGGISLTVWIEQDFEIPPFDYSGTGLKSRILAVPSCFHSYLLYYRGWSSQTW
jgi:hypothetical protein